MAETQNCADCHCMRPVEEFYKTRGGTGRSSRCRNCIEMRAEAYREHQRRQREKEDNELEAFLSVSSNQQRQVPNHLLAAFNRIQGSAAQNRKPKKLSNRPHMTRCEGCGEAVPKHDLFEYRRGKRAKYCKPCMKRRAVERECLDCGETKLTSEFFEGLGGVSPYCCACREKREREKHCPRCNITKSVNEFNCSGGRLAGWCKKCSVDAQRERRSAARL